MRSGDALSGRTRLRTALAVPLVIAVAMGPGCSSETDSTAVTTTSVGTESSTTADGTSTSITPPPETTTTTTTTVEQAAADVEAAYLAYWAMYHRVNDPPSPGDPDIAALSTGPARTDLEAIVDTNLQQGLVLRIPPDGVGEHTITGVTVDGGTARMQDCYVDDGQVIDAASGSVLNGEVVTKLIEAALVFEDGAWKVERYEFLQRTLGVSGCAVS